MHYKWQGKSYKFKIVSSNANKIVKGKSHFGYKIKIVSQNFNGNKFTDQDCAVKDLATDIIGLWISVAKSLTAQSVQDNVPVQVMVRFAALQILSKLQLLVVPDKSVYER